MKCTTLFTMLVALLLLSAVQISFAQNLNLEQYLQNGNGARAAGMGYAFTGLADDATAISWNTAGLTQLHSPEASIIARFGAGVMTPEYSDPSFTVDVTSGSKFQLNFASLAIPFSAGNLNVVGGVAYRRVYDFTMKNTAVIGIPEFNYEGELVTDNSGGVDAISPAIGIQFNEMISAGAAANIFIGSTDYIESYNENMNVLGSYDFQYSEEYSGVSFDIGLLLKPSHQIQLGANLNLPNAVTILEKSAEYEDYEYKLYVPFFFSVGAAFRVTDQLTLAADYRSRPWSGAEIETEEETLSLEEALQDILNDPELTVYNANSFHFGLEYLISAGDFVLPLRAGFFTVPTPGEDDERNQIKYNSVTAGLGLVLGNIILDGSFEYMFGSYVLDAQDETKAKITDVRITLGGVIHLGG